MESVRGRLGPNAIIQVAVVLERRLGAAAGERLFEAAGLGAAWHAPPESLVEASSVRALHAVLWQRLGDQLADEVLHSAGEATGRYLLAHRIPAPAQRALRVMPRAIGAWALAAAIRRHAWTFGGDGRVRLRGRIWPGFVFDDPPLCGGLHAGRVRCGYLASTFECLYRALIDPRLMVTVAECAAAGGTSCRYVLGVPRAVRHRIEVRAA